LLVWTCSCSDPIEGEHYTHGAQSSAGSYSISVSTSFPSFEFIGYSVSFCPTGGRWSKDEVELGSKPKLDDAKAIAQRHADKAKPQQVTRVRYRPTPPTPTSMSSTAPTPSGKLARRR
jgi:hypothetical protein